MPDQEKAFLREHAVLWPFNAYDKFGQPVVGPFKALKVRFVWHKKEMLDPKRNTITVDATAQVPHEIPVGSIIWKGNYLDLVGTASPGALWEVKACDVTPDLKARAAYIIVGLMRYKEVLPLQVTKTLPINVLPPPPPPGATYYVAPTGNDANPGTASQPFLTLNKAASVVVPGDSVFVSPGSYGGFNILANGTSAKPITWKGSLGTIINKAMNWGGILFGINVSGPSYNIIDGFTIAPASTEPNWDYGIRMSGIFPSASPPAWALGNIIKNSTVSMRVVPKGNQTSNFDKDGIFSAWQDGIQVLNNVVSGGWDSGIYTSNSSKNYVIRGNTVFNVGGNGIHNNGDISQGAPGINNNALIEKNTIHDCGFGIGGQCISCDGVQNSRIQNNLIYNAYAKGISLYVVNAGGGSTGNIVVNNTVFCITATGGNPGVCMRVDGGSTFNTILNNIWQRSGGGTSNWVYELTPDPSVLTVDYNSVVLATDGTVQLGESWTNWQNGLGWDVHGYIARAIDLCVNPAGNDYHLKVGTVAFNKGTASNAPSDDLEGNPRPSFGGYDTGCYQIGKQTALPTGKRLIQSSWLQLLGVQTLPTSLGANAYGGLAVRLMNDNSLHFFVVDRFARGIIEVADAGFGSNLATCPRATLVTNWGTAIFEGLGLDGTDPNHCEHQGLLWNPSNNSLYVTQGDNYDVTPGPLPIWIQIIFNNDNTTTAKGPWFADISQQCVRNYIMYAPAWFLAYTSGRTMLTGSGLESGSLAQSQGPGLVAADTPDNIAANGTFHTAFASHFPSLNPNFPNDPYQFNRRYRRTPDYTPVVPATGLPAAYPGVNGGLQNPVPDGTGGYWQNIDVIRAALFIDGPTFTGILYFGRMGAWDLTSGVLGVHEGATWYGEPVLPNGITADCFSAKGGNAANYVSRWFIQDPSIPAAVLQGQLATWHANPTEVFDPTVLFGAGLVLHCDHRITGACSDPRDPTIFYVTAPQVDTNAGGASPGLAIYKIKINAP